MTITAGTYQVTKAVLGNGIYMYTYFRDNCAAPLGFVWGTGHHGIKLRFDVMGSYVIPHERRQGVRTKINARILHDYDVITTQDGTPDGRKFMMAAGYMFDKRLDQWYKLKERKRGTR
jgi:hypothetical protein